MNIRARLIVERLISEEFSPEFSEGAHVEFAMRHVSSDEFGGDHPDEGDVLTVQSLELFSHDGEKAQKDFEYYNLKRDSDGKEFTGISGLHLTRVGDPYDDDDVTGAIDAERYPADQNGFDRRAPFPHASDPHWSDPQADHPYQY